MIFELNYVENKKVDCENMTHFIDILSKEK